MARRDLSILSFAILLTVLFSATFPVRSVYAASITVNGTADTIANDGQCTLREAIINANNDNTSGSTDCAAGSGSDTLILPAGTYVLTLSGFDNTSAGGDLDINSDITIIGAGAGSTIIRQTVATERVIHIVSNYTVNISGVTITGGDEGNAQGGGGVQNNGTLTINNSVITGNTTTTNGGGVFNANGALVIQNVTFSGNSAAGRGGGLLTTGTGTLSIRDSLFENNTAAGNNSYDGGGAIHTDHDITVQRTTFRNNTYTGSAHGGGAILATGGITAISDSVFEGNQGDGNGGGAIASAGDFFSPTLIVTTSTFQNNTATGNFGEGGAINANGNLSVTRSTFDGNRANGNDASGSGNGGGIIIINGDLVLENVTMSGNRANRDGGAVYYRADSSALLRNVTIASNTADADTNGVGSGGGVFSTGAGIGSDLVMNNSLLAGNTGNTGRDCSGFIGSSAGHNLIQTPGSACTLGGVTSGNLIGQNPNLGPLANNGGPTQTRALLSGSPAVDAGDPGSSCLTTDQRGIARFDGNYDGIVRCDIGAYEFNQPAPPAPAPTLPQTGFPQGRWTRLPEQSSEKAYAATELTLEIPSLGVKAPIVGVLKSGGTWDVSWLGNSVGWLEGSAFPTWAGNTVITGHVWNADNTPGIFANLKSLKYGDRFTIHAFGQTYVYEVRENTWLWSWNGTASVFKHEEYDWVTLLTCEGYNPLTGSYLFRRMVRAVLVEVK